MGGKAVVAAIDFCDGQRDPLAGPGVKRAFRKRAVEAQISFQRSGRIADDAEKVGHHAKLFLDSL